MKTTLKDTSKPWDYRPSHAGQFAFSIIHTPFNSSPYQIGAVSYISPEWGSAEANAALIVRAVNSHEKACGVLNRCLALFGDEISHADSAELKRDIEQTLREMQKGEAAL